MGALARPDSVGHWVSEQIRMRGNRRHKHRMETNSIRPLSAEDFVVALTGQVTLPVGYSSELDAIYLGLETQIREFYRYDGHGRSPSTIDLEDARVLYLLCRTTRPSTVVETGVSDGVSTAIILSALEKNNHGRLVSIDFPLVGIPRLYGKSPGWVVPDGLRARWTLIKGRSVKLLPEVLSATGPIELFFHDSEHSYDCMLQELVSALRSISPGGMAISDDGWVSSALRDAACQVLGVADPVRFTTHGMGGIRVPDPLEAKS